MELYILDNFLRRQTVVDKFESLIWTDRFYTEGGFELVIYSTPENRALFLAGTLLATNTSVYVMVVQYIEDDWDTEGRSILRVTGPSLENILKDRVAKSTLSGTTAEPRWDITGTPGAIARWVFHQICVVGTLNTGDIIPYIHETNSLFWADTIPEPATSMTISFEPMSVYDAISQVCSQYNLGFRLCRNPNDNQLYFNIYSGVDRTSLQTVSPSVVFSKDLETFQNTKEIATVTSYKNVAYVFSPVGYQVVYAAGVDSAVAGFSRRVLMVNADDITSTDGPTATAQMIQRGVDELAKNRSLYGFDGELGKNKFVYMQDYSLGDLVEVRNTDGVTANMRVTEQIFVSDREGERSYPTLTISQIVGADSWLGWDYSKHWADGGATEYWATS